jgi:hypothetical protein
MKRPLRVRRLHTTYERASEMTFDPFWISFERDLRRSGIRLVIVGHDAAIVDSCTGGTSVGTMVSPSLESLRESAKGT